MVNIDERTDLRMPKKRKNESISSPNEEVTRIKITEPKGKKNMEKKIDNYIKKEDENNISEFNKAYSKLKDNYEGGDEEQKNDINNDKYEKTKTLPIPKIQPIDLRQTSTEIVIIQEVQSKMISQSISSSSSIHNLRAVAN
jgi:hypothetical protein